MQQCHYRLLLLLCTTLSLQSMQPTDVRYKQITLHQNPKKEIYGLRLIRDTLHLITNNRGMDEPCELHMKGFNTNTGTTEKKSSHNLTCLLVAAGLDGESHLWHTNRYLLSMLAEGILPTVQFPNYYTGIMHFFDQPKCNQLRIYTIDGLLQKTLDNISHFEPGWVTKRLITMSKKNSRILQFHDENFSPVSTFTLPETDDHEITTFNQLDNNDIVIQKIKEADGDLLSSVVSVYDTQKNHSLLFEQDGLLISSANRSFLTLSNDTQTVNWYARTTDNRYACYKSFAITESDRDLILKSSIDEPKLLSPYFLLASHTNDVLFSRTENQDATRIQATVYKTDSTIHQIIPDLTYPSFIYSDGSFFTVKNTGTAYFYIPEASGDHSPLVIDELDDDLVIIEKDGMKIMDIS